MIYRICTEYRSNLSGLVAAYFDCFTIIEGEGHWRGKTERSATIEIPAERADRDKVQDLAVTIRTINHQEAVLMQEILEYSSAMLYKNHIEVFYK